LINWLKNIWVKLFGYPTDSYYNLDFDPEKNAKLTTLTRPAYDPALDEERVLRGETESYFD
jgi:hypothetical protein